MTKESEFISMLAKELGKWKINEKWKISICLAGSEYCHERRIWLEASSNDNKRAICEPRELTKEAAEYAAGYLEGHDILTRNFRYTSVEEFARMQTKETLDETGLLLKEQMSNLCSLTSKRMPVAQEAIGKLVDTFGNWIQAVVAASRHD